ncbi:DUF6005 family protein [Pararhodobacter sp. CCB-MM2]|uniref:DUF6005 family protein n=1 Tax=Pararhodobacter sp. CCB-MM2 TaxID=1786003 RepID=UPI00082BA42A|nr:DUF6005 family protein [Pararhodobacter sp. CCB-MM2]
MILQRPLPSPETARNAIHAALRGPVACPCLDLFRPEARLGTDLGLDSVAMLTLVLSLEEQGISMPEAAFDQAPGLTVQALADLLAGIAPAPAEEPVDIKVHCVVSCLCQAVKDAGGIDHRALYLGLWDGQVVVDERACLSYHAPGIDHGFYLHWAERLFGLKVTRWYDARAGKPENLRRLHALLDAWRPGDYVMPMVDMFLLPQRDNKFAQDPFPHYALLQPTDDPDLWHMRDPDYRWEGDLPAKDLTSAFLRETVAGGFAFSRHGLQAPAPAVIAEMFEAVFEADHHPLIEALTAILEAHETRLPRRDLELALRELPVIAIRKYAYEHGFAVLGDIEGPDWDAFEEVCERIAALQGGFGVVQRRAVAWARGGPDDELARARSELERLAALEGGIKATLLDWYRRWKSRQPIPGAS